MKTAAYLIAMLIGFGIVGRMDYEDAVAFEAAQYNTQTASNQQ
jgi:hypothetical protein